MSDFKEQLSAFLDDGLDPGESLQSEHAARDTLVRYNLIGDAMRGDINEATLTDVSAQIRQAIDNEARAGEAADAADEIAAVRTPSPRAATAGPASWFDFSSWLRPVGGLAVAASVAMVVVVTLQPDQGGIPAGNLAGDPAAGQQVIADGTPRAADIAPAQVRTVAATRPAAVPPSVINLDQYLDEHSEFAASDTLQGRLPYVRAVGYKSK